jgi:hypothetical protein
MQAVQADQEIQAKGSEATAKFRLEQGGLGDSVAKQLGVSKASKEFQALRDRHTKTVTEAMESAAAAGGARSGKRARPRNR